MSMFDDIPVEVGVIYEGERIRWSDTHVELGGPREKHKFELVKVRDLKEIEEEEVEISYKCNANIVGKLAMFGDRILKAKAKTLEADFTSALKETLKRVVNN